MSEKLFYIPRVVPTGDAPEEIRSKWLGVPMRIERISSPLPGSLVGAHDRKTQFEIGDGQRTAEVKSGTAIMALRAFGLDDIASHWSEVANDATKQYKALGLNMDPQNYPLHFLFQEGDQLLLPPQVLTMFDSLGLNNFGVEYVRNFIA
jgi:hypothetical protein